MPFPPTTAGRKPRIVQQPTVAIGRATAEATGNALETGGNLAAFVTRVGEVQASPTANTLLDRVKATNTKLDTLITAIGGLQTSLNTANGHLATIATNTTP